MPLKYKVNVLEELKKAGYNSNRLRIEKLLSECVIQSFRKGKPVSWAAIETVCGLLNKQPGSILKYEKQDQEGE